MSQTNILLETGTNELEIVVFTVGGNTYGINVAKVEKILKMPELSEVPKANPAIEGLFQYREKVIPLINLEKYLSLKPSSDPEKDRTILTTFNGVFTSFHVHTVSRIHRISWENVETPDSDSVSYNEAVTGVVRFNEKIILLLDFEKIIFDISPHNSLTTDVDNSERMSENVRNNKKIVVAEDSTMLRQMLIDTLTKAGYSNLEVFKNGKDAWDYLNENKNNPDLKPELLITDIEMPQMDGHHLTKLTRNEAEYQELPIVIFSSLINDAMYNKGLSIGASEQISKPQILKLVHILDDYLID